MQLQTITCHAAADVGVVAGRGVLLLAARSRRAVVVMLLLVWLLVWLLVLLLLVVPPWWSPAADAKAGTGTSGAVELAVVGVVAVRLRLGPRQRGRRDGVLGAGPEAATARHQALLDQRRHRQLQQALAAGWGGWMVGSGWAGGQVGGRAGGQVGRLPTGNV